MALTWVVAIFCIVASAALGVAAVWPLRIPEGPDALDQPRPPGSQRGAWELRVPPGSRPVRGREEAMQYRQVRILCAPRDKIAENDTSLTGHQAMDRARARMTRLGSGSRELFDLKGRDG